MSKHSVELAAIEARYERRKDPAINDRYSPWNAWSLNARQELERGLAAWMRSEGIAPPAARTVLEVGCGTGGVLRLLVGLGFSPSHLVGNELLKERIEQARQTLPAAVRLIGGNAADLQFEPGSFDIVVQATVLSSILDPELRRDVAATMWRLTRPGGGVLSYDLAVRNPANRDVTPITKSEIRRLFPEGRVQARRVTLAPPLGRILAPLGSVAYAGVGLMPLFRSHLLCWIPKYGPAPSDQND